MTYIVRAESGHINNRVTTQIRTDILAVAIMIVDMIPADDQIVAADVYRFDGLGEISVESEKHFSFFIERSHFVVGCDEYLVRNSPTYAAQLNAFHFFRWQCLEVDLNVVFLNRKNLEHTVLVANSNLVWENEKQLGYFWPSK